MSDAPARGVPDRSTIRAANAAQSYETLRQRHIQDMRARAPQALERLSWPAERLKAERNERLRNLLRFAKERSRWHRARLARVDPERVTEESIRDIPPMTKHDLMENFDAIVTDPQVTLDVCEAHLASLKSDAYLLDRYHVNASGGSSGRRGLAVFDWDAWAEFYVVFMRQLIRWRMRDPGAAGKPVVGAAVAAQDPTHASGSLPVTFSDPASGVWHRFPVTLPLEQIVDGLNRLQPHVIVIYPSLLHQIAFAAQEGALEISPGLIICSSEPLLPEIRAAAGAVWSAPILNNWASTEAGAMASSCGAGAGLHLSDDVLIVEPVDERCEPIAIGARSAKVLATPLFNAAPLPLIRYELTDEITLLDEPCPCGSAHRLVADIEGRLDDMFEYAGRTTVHPHVFRSRLGKERYIVEYQVRQTADGADIDIHCNGRVESGPLRQALIDDLQRVGLRGADIVIASVERIERPASGKLKRFVPLIAQEEERMFAREQFLILCTTLACVSALHAAQAAKTYGPGVSDVEIRIGQTMPYSGPLSGYGSIGRAQAAYFEKVNAEGGVNGRKIKLISLDDGFNPARTVEQTRKLIDEEQVLALSGSLGTVTNNAIRKEVNARKVPHLFLLSGASQWADPQNFPWSMGWAPLYQAEAKLYAQYLLRTKPAARVAVLYQNDDHGKEYLKGFKDGLGPRVRSMIVAEASHAPSDPTVDSQVVTLQASRADVFMNFATAKAAAQAIRKAYDIGWKPQQLLTATSSSVEAVLKPASPEKAVGIVSAAFLKDPSDPQWKDDPAMQQWRAWMKMYYPEGNAADVFNVVGYSLAQTLVQVLKQCGDDLSRENVMRQAANLRNLELPMLLPGVRIDTSAHDYLPLEQVQLMRFDGAKWVHFGEILTGDARPGDTQSAHAR